jgi:hypothetical protein
VIAEPPDGAVFVAERAGRGDRERSGDAGARARTAGGGPTRGAGDDALDVAVETHGLPPEEPLEVVVDGRAAARLAPPYRARLRLARGDHVLEVRPADPRRAALLGRAGFSVR